MSALAEIVPIRSRRTLTEADRLRAELETARGQIDQLTGIAADQAKAIAELTDECPPWAPSVAIVYWLWSDACRAKRSWHLMWARIAPLVSAVGALPAPKLTPLVWERHRATRKLLGLCDATINLELGYAKQMLNWAVDHGLIKRNPLQSAKAVRTVSRRETRLTPEDVEKLLAASDDVVNRSLLEGDDTRFRGPLLRAFILCMFDSMLRFNEARLLKLDRILGDGSYELWGSD